MLETHLISLPYTKFVLIQDAAQAKAKDITEHLLRFHGKNADYRVHSFRFFNGSNSGNAATIHRYDLDQANCETDLLGIGDKCVVFIDSLAHFVYHVDGLGEAYRILGELKAKSNIVQVIGVLHADLLEENDVTKCLEHLSTLNVKLETKSRLTYTHKKSAGKVVTKTENYRFEGEDRRLVCEAPPKQQKLLPNDSSSAVKPMLVASEPAVVAARELRPEEMSSFKIGLSDKDRESREALVLPYLPKETSEINYTLDNVDDWDEEDPDDDLDI